MTNSRILVTGANGFLGSEIVRQANSVGLGVRTTDRDEPLPVPGIDYYRVDILNSDSLNLLMDGVKHVIHAAGLAHIFDKTQAVVDSFKAVNEIGTANLAAAAARAGVQHFLLISSVSVYGRSASPDCDENTVCDPEGPYAESKLGAERCTIEIAKASGMHVTILRLATAYGEGDPGNVGRLMRAIDRGSFRWIGSGLNRKSLIHKEDVGRACLAVLQNPPMGINIYNVSAPPCTMRELVEGIAKALNRPIPRVHIPASLVLTLAYVGKTISGGHDKLGNLYSTLKKWLAEDVYDSSKFEKTFDFKTQVSLDEGLRREVAWYRNQKSQNSRK